MCVRVKVLGLKMYRRKPQPRAPSNHTALVSLPNVNDIVTPASGSGVHSNSSISKRKFLNLYTSTVKKTRVGATSKRPRGDGATDSGSNGYGDEKLLQKIDVVDQGTDGKPDEPITVPSRGLASYDVQQIHESNSVDSQISYEFNAIRMRLW